MKPMAPATRLAVVTALLLAAGCASVAPPSGEAPVVHRRVAPSSAAQAPASAPAPVPAPEHGTAAPRVAEDVSEPPSPERAEVVMRALSLVGIDYRFGGDTPENGLDCSGFVRHVYQEAAGLSLPRRAEEISRAGREVPVTALRPGDLVFFNTLRRPFSHVGLYIGNDQFVHAPSRGKRIRVESMNGRYWTARFDGARRVGDTERVADARP